MGEVAPIFLNFNFTIVFMGQRLTGRPGLKEPLHSVLKIPKITCAKQITPIMLLTAPLILLEYQSSLEMILNTCMYIIWYLYDI